MIDLAHPVGIRAAMARAGLAPMQSRPYHDAERGYVDPITEDPQAVRSFMSNLWRACERAESPTNQPKDHSPA